MPPSPPTARDPQSSSVSPVQTRTISPFLSAYKPPIFRPAIDRNARPAEKRVRLGETKTGRDESTTAKDSRDANVSYLVNSSVADIGSSPTRLCLPGHPPPPINQSAEDRLVATRYVRWPPSMLALHPRITPVRSWLDGPIRACVPAEDTAGRRIPWSTTGSSCLLADGKT